MLAVRSHPRRSIRFPARACPPSPPAPPSRRRLARCRTWRRVDGAADDLVDEASESGPSSTGAARSHRGRLGTRVDSLHRRGDPADASTSERLENRRTLRSRVRHVRPRCEERRASLSTGFNPGRRSPDTIGAQSPRRCGGLPDGRGMARRGDSKLAQMASLPLRRGDPRVMRTAIWLLLLQASLGAFDTLYYHEYRLQLAHGQPHAPGTAPARRA